MNERIPSNPLRHVDPHTCQKITSSLLALLVPIFQYLQSVNRALANQLRWNLNQIKTVICTGTYRLQNGGHFVAFAAYPYSPRIVGVVSACNKLHIIISINMKCGRAMSQGLNMSNSWVWITNVDINALDIHGAHSIDYSSLWYTKIWLRYRWFWWIWLDWKTTGKAKTWPFPKPLWCHHRKTFTILLPLVREIEPSLLDSLQEVSVIRRFDVFLINCLRNNQATDERGPNAHVTSP